MTSRLQLERFQASAELDALVARTRRSHSPKKFVDGIEHAEDGLNGFPGNDIAKKFKDDEYRMPVANKFLTNFDERCPHNVCR